MMPNYFFGQGQQGVFGGPYGAGYIPVSTVGPGMLVTSFGALHCPICGYSGPSWHAGPSPVSAWGPGYGIGPQAAAGWGLGGLRRWGGSYSPQYISTGLPTDEEITEMVYDALDSDPLVPYDADIEVSVDSGVVTLSGTVPNKRVKHSIGDDAWWVPGVVDVRNDVQVGGRRRARSAPKESGEEAATGAGRVSTSPRSSRSGQ